jgi:hypothetical protein
MSQPDKTRPAARAEPQDGAEVARAGLRARRGYGPKAPRSTVLTPAEEAMAVAFRRHTLLPLDDCLYALQATIPHLRVLGLQRQARTLFRLRPGLPPRFEHDHDKDGCEEDHAGPRRTQPKAAVVSRLGQKIARRRAQWTG